MAKPKTNTQAKITPKRIMGNFFFIESHSFIKLRFLIFKLAGGEQHFMLFADGKSTRDSRISGARECSSLDGTK